MPPRKKVRTANNAPRAPRAFKDELKYTVVTSTPFGVSFAGGSQSLFANLSRGNSGKDNYDGNGLTPKSVTVRLAIKPQSTIDMVRIIVAQQIKGALPSAANLLDTTGSISTPLASFNRPYKRTVKILADRLYAASNSESGIYTDTIYIKGKKLVPLEVLSGAQTTTSGDIAIYYYSQVTAAGPVLDYYTEVTFTD